jgi:hypothetical protein
LLIIKPVLENLILEIDNPLEFPTKTRDFQKA